MVALKQQNNGTESKLKFAMGEFGVNEIWEVAQRRWKLLTACVLAAWLLGLAMCYFMPPTYESKSQVLVMRKDTSTVTADGPRSSGDEPKVSEDTLATHTSIIMSEKIIEAALDHTVSKKIVDARREAQFKNEEQTSGNLRHIIGRSSGLIKPSEPVPLPEIKLWSVVAEEKPEDKTSEEGSGTEAAASMTGDAAASAATMVSPVTSTTPPSTPDAVTAVSEPASPVPSNPAPSVEAAKDPVTAEAKSSEPSSTTSPSEVIVATSETTPTPIADEDLIQLRNLPGIVAKLDFNQKPSEYVLDNLSVGRGSGQAREAHVLSVGFKHTDPIEAQIVVDAILHAYQEFLNEKFQNVSKEAAKLIESASGEKEKEFAAAQAQYLKFREEAPMLFAGGETATNIHRQRFDSAQSELSTVQLKLSEATARMYEVEQTFAILQSNGSSTLEWLALIDDTNAARLGAMVQLVFGEAGTPDFQSKNAERIGVATLETKELQGMRIREQALAQDYGPNHPEVKLIKEQIRKLEEHLADRKLYLKPEESEVKVDPKTVMNAYVRMLRNDTAVLMRKEQELKETAAREEEMAKSLVGYELEAEKLREQVTRAQTLYQTVIDRLGEINLAKDYSGFINEVIESPRVGTEIWPDVPLVMALCTALGLVFGAGTAGYLEYRDRSFRDPNDIRRDLDLPLLTHVPDLRPKGNDAKILVEGSKMHTSLYSFHRPKSREAEVFRGLRTSLFFSGITLNGNTGNGHGTRCQVIEFTSPNQGDGKSTVTGNLACSIAQAGKKVLLVDCDLRRPNVHKLLGLPNKHGLADIIADGTDPMNVIQQTDAQNLWAITSGAIPTNPAELLTSTDFENFIEMAREKFDFIMLDCPPVLAVADPCIVAPRADGIALVIRVSRDSRPQATRAKDMLMRVNAKILGVVVNASQEASKTGYGRYSESGYGYSYDYGYGNGYYQYNKYYEDDPTATKRPERTERRDRTDRGDRVKVS